MGVMKRLYELRLFKGESAEERHEKKMNRVFPKARPLRTSSQQAAKAAPKKKPQKPG